MKINLDSQTEEVRIEIIPLLDVIFCILTFFLLAALQVTGQQAINVDLPRAGTGRGAEMREMLIVSLDQIGQTYVDQRPVTREELYKVLLSYNQGKPDGLIVLYASKMTSYNDVVKVLDLLRSVGGDRVALATLPGSGELPKAAPQNQPGTPSPGIPVAPSQLPPPPSVNPGDRPTPGAKAVPGNPNSAPKKAP